MAALPSLGVCVTIGDQHASDHWCGADHCRNKRRTEEGKKDSGTCSSVCGHPLPAPVTPFLRSAASLSFPCPCNILQGHHGSDRLTVKCRETWIDIPSVTLTRPHVIASQKGKPQKCSLDRVRSKPSKYTGPRVDDQRNAHSRRVYWTAPIIAAGVASMLAGRLMCLYNGFLPFPRNFQVRGGCLPPGYQLHRGIYGTRSHKATRIFSKRVLSSFTTRRIIQLQVEGVGC